MAQNVIRRAANAGSCFLPPDGAFDPIEIVEQMAQATRTAVDEPPTSRC